MARVAPGGGKHRRRTVAGVRRRTRESSPTAPIRLLHVFASARKRITEAVRVGRYSNVFSPHPFSPVPQASIEPNTQRAASKMATLKLTKYKLLVLYAFCHYMSSEPASSQQGSSEGISSHFAHALLYHQFQPTPAPLLSRYNRQPHPSSSSNASHYADSAQNYQDTRHQQRLQTSFLNARDSSSDEFAEDPYGCPVECQCNKIAQIADCSNRNLSRVPVSFPKDIKRIRLERNNITDIGPYAFQGLKRLQRIDLSNNNLYKIDALAFSGGLQALNSLILYSNKLEHLPVNVFNELSQLQLLLLNANSLQTIHKDLFHALANLNLLSLYDNNIATLSSGTFDGLRNIKTM